MAFDRRPSSCVTKVEFLTTHDTPSSSRARDRMHGVRIVEHDDNKGRRTTFQFKLPFGKSASEAGAEVRYLSHDP